MKKLLTTAALLSAMFAISPALADDVDPRAYSFTLSYVYDGFCEKLPPLLMQGVELEMKDIPAAVLAPAQKKVDDQLGKLGRTEFCARAKSLINKALDSKETPQ